MLSFSVGVGQRNQRTDVKVVQTLLNKKFSRAEKLSVDGVIGPKTIERINRFQAEYLRFSHPDGIVYPTGKTLKALMHISQLHQTLPVFNSVGGGVISEQAYINAAQSLDCEVAAIKAIALTESKHSPFLSPGRPYILYEKHYFGRLTHHQFDDSHPDISGRHPYKHYGSYEEQYKRLEEAKKLNREAALKSVSWGAFQIMGANFQKAGFSNVESFVTAMNSIDGQFYAFIHYVKGNRTLLVALRNKSWATVANLYNGPDYRQNNYDVKIANNYQFSLH